MGSDRGALPCAAGRPLVCVVTGFLGSGKTTFVRRILDATGASGIRAVALVNDIAEYNVDAEILGAGAKTAKLSNGCVCCSLNDSFVDAVCRVVDEQAPEYLIVETSGVSDPFPLLESLRHPRLAQRCSLDAVVTLVDASGFEPSFGGSAAMRSQVECADVILVNKADVASEEQVHEVQDFMRSMKREPRHITCIRANVPLHLVLSVFDEVRPRRSGDEGADRGRAGGGGGAPSVDPMALLGRLGKPSSHLSEDGVATISFECAGPLSLQRFQRFVEALPAGVLRCKGFARFCSCPGLVFEVHACGQRYEATGMTPNGDSGGEAGSRLVLIGKDLDKRACLAALAACGSDRCSGASEGRRRDANALRLQQLILQDKRFSLHELKDSSQSVVAFSLRGSFGKLGSLPPALVRAANMQLAASVSLRHSLCLSTVAPPASVGEQTLQLIYEVADDTDVSLVWGRVQREAFVVLASLVDPQQQQFYGARGDASE